MNWQARPPARRALVVVTALAVAVAAGAVVSAQTDGPRPGWRRLVSTNFVAVGNAAEADIRAAVGELEAFRAALASHFPSVLSPALVRPTVVVYRDAAPLSAIRRDDEPASAGSMTAGFFVARPDVAYIVISSQPPGSVGHDTMFRVVFHEYVHDVLRRERSRLPLWLNEGLAEFYGSAERTPRGVEVGRALDDRLRALRSSRRIELEDLMRISDYGELRGTGRELMFYAQAWALTNYLMAGHDGHRAGQLDAFLEELDLGLSPEAAFESAFRVSYEDLAAEVDAFIRQNRFPVIVLAPPAEPVLSASPFESVLESEAAGIEGDVFLRMGVLDEADRRLTRAAASYPESLDVRVPLAILRLEQNRPEEAVALLRPVVQARPDWFTGHWYLARALRLSGSEAESLDAYRTAIELNPSLAPGWFFER